MNKINVNGKNVIPSKIVCIGRNYVEHIKELGNEVATSMVIFTKPNSAIADELYAYHGEPLHYESEICFIYHNNTFSYVGFGLDLTKRNLQSTLKSVGLPWERAKAFDGSAIFSKFVPFSNVDNMSIELTINSLLQQQANIELMIYTPNEILTEIQSFMQLNDGDIVMTGTPKGVGVVPKDSIFTGTIKQNKHVLVTHSWQAK